jgi:hypothetical protein
VGHGILLTGLWVERSQRPPTSFGGIVPHFQQARFFAGKIMTHQTDHAAETDQCPLPSDMPLYVASTHRMIHTEPSGKRG